MSRPRRAGWDAPSAITLATVLIFALLTVGDARRGFSDWQLPAPDFSGDDYAAIVLTRADRDSSSLVGIALRQDPGQARLEKVAYPADLDLMRDRIEYGGRMLSPVWPRYVTDVLAGKVASETYDPVLSREDWDALQRSGTLVPYGDEVLVDRSSPGATAFRVFTDPAREVFVVLPEASR